MENSIYLCFNKKKIRLHTTKKLRIMKATELTKEALVEGLIITTDNPMWQFKVTRVTEKSFFTVNSSCGGERYCQAESRHALKSGIEWFNSLKFQ